MKPLSVVYALPCAFFSCWGGAACSLALFTRGLFRYFFQNHVAPEVLGPSLPTDIVSVCSFSLPEAPLLADGLCLLFSRVLSRVLLDWVLPFTPASCWLLGPPLLVMTRRSGGDGGYMKQFGFSVHIYIIFCWRFLSICCCYCFVASLEFLVFSRKGGDQKECKRVISLFYIRFDKNFLKGFAVESLIKPAGQKTDNFPLYVWKGACG